ncbi:MAG: hypothetical protein HY740_07765, partial [Chloroflexi bacterium]|nr:hypothetical protein [Chloroflexota bacterium]
MPTQPKLEGEVFYPSQSVIDQAHIKDWETLAAKAGKDLAGFWGERA